ncbi:MAG: type I restriction enzyme HsdR N-terminal domain-containing protein [Chitinivibrionia bacterium]|nr:type I restriction enzyme HsdR N-terminal domain-containing protein [Chitinivibrionia bacterium]
METKEKIFSDLDFDKVKDFNESDVRADIIEPIIKALGFSGENIVREKHFELQSGSKKEKTTLIPDYLLKIGESYAWVLEAKAPDKNIFDCVKQAYSYASHIEIRSIYFALCNGVEFAAFRTNSPDSPVLFFKISEIDNNLESLKKLLSVNCFQSGKTVSYEKPILSQNRDFDYLNRPLLKEIPVKKRAAKRHFGVHGYFTRQTWNVVAEYIRNFSQKGDIVLDPFGGSGITAVEALMNGRKAINIDINPLAIFLVNSLIAPINKNELSTAFEEVKTEYIKKEPKNDDEVDNILSKYSLPKDLKLPKNSDVKSVHKLFSKKQLSQLALLKAIIKKQKNKNIQKTLMLMFSGTITRVNLTYHTSTSVKAKTGFGGNSAPFSYYRYRKAPNPTSVDIMQCFELRYQKVLAAKEEIRHSVNENTADYAQIIKGTATDLSFLDNESVDYIYTDPPYGKKIPYLDLSVMWNAWLDLEVSDDDYELEAIEGGEHNKSKNEYNNLISKSIQEMYRVLKFDRWMSFVFAHKDPEFWHLIIETAQNCGFEYVGAVPQKNGQTSFKKRQNPFTVLSGELIINFRKVRNPIAILKANLGMSIGEIVIQTIEGVIAKNDGATLEQINDELIIKGLELGFLDLLKKEYVDLQPILSDKFDFDNKSEKYNIKEKGKFQTHVDVKLRIKYYIISYLRRIEREKKTASFDEIVMNIMPLLKNGVTPEAQTILSVLEDIGEKLGENTWRLKEEKPTLFSSL